MPEPRDLRRCLFFLRLGVFVVMIFWTLDKFYNPAHTAKVFENFYFTSGVSPALSYTIGTFQLLVVLGFLLGYRKKLTYGLVFLMHAVSTFSSFNMYLNPWEPGSLLFFAAWPMLAALYVLFTLREHDNILSIEKGPRNIFP